ncbi:MAG: alpha/beta fold hydrolase [Alphaproteobacteria bacterium]|nr:alpha/beta fold hydrolase [Alphaproteobacteria bacterium]
MSQGFVQTPGNPAPEGLEELWLTSKDGARLRFAFAPGPANPRGTVVLCPGRTEFIEKYFEPIKDFQARGFCVLCVDWRGQGLSERATKNPLKGHLETLDRPAKDLAFAIRTWTDRLPRPRIIVAHSMGGGIILRGLQQGYLHPAAALFSAPMWGIKAPPGASLLASAAYAVGAGKGFVSSPAKQWAREPFEDQRVTHSRERHERGQDILAANPDLAIAGPTYAWLRAALKAIHGFRKPEALAHVAIPVVVVSAGEEKLVDNDSHLAVAGLLPNAKHITVPGAYHELMMETDDIRAQFLAAFDDLAARVASPTPADATA